jgi:hypothetical protein
VKQFFEYQKSLMITPQNMEKSPYKKGTICVLDGIGGFVREVGTNNRFQFTSQTRSSVPKILVEVEDYNDKKLLSLGTAVAFTAHNQFITKMALTDMTSQDFVDDWNAFVDYQRENHGVTYDISIFLEARLKRQNSNGLSYSPSSPSSPIFNSVDHNSVRKPTFSQLKKIKEVCTYEYYEEFKKVLAVENGDIYEFPSDVDYFPTSIENIDTEYDRFLAFKHTKENDSGKDKVKDTKVIQIARLEDQTATSFIDEVQPHLDKDKDVKVKIPLLIDGVVSHEEFTMKQVDAVWTRSAYQEENILDELLQRFTITIESAKKQHEYNLNLFSQQVS